MRPASVRVAVSPAVSLAILKVNSDRLSLDLIEQFVPFVADALRQEGPDVISANDLQRCVQELFGLTMPIGALKVVLSRCAKRGLVTQANGVYRTNRNALAKQPNLMAERASVLRQHQALIEKLRLHASSVLDTELSEEVAEAALLRYIALRAAPLLATAVDGAPIIRMDPNAADDSQLLVEAFAISLYESDPDGFAYLSTIVKGSILASALYLQGEIATADRAFKKVVFYIDAPLLARALGYCTPEQSLGSRELLELLQAEGAQLACFTHNFEEINGILERAHRDVADPRRHRTATRESVKFFLDTGVSPSDIVEKQRSLRADLEAMGVVIRDKPPTIRTNSVDEFALEDELSEVQYSSDEQRTVDVASLTAIWRLRKGGPVWRLEEAGAMFVTGNNDLVAGARAFFSGEQGPTAIPVAMRDDVLATLAWLKKPGLKPDLPVRMVVADCFAALRPPDEAWPEYLKVIKDLEARGQITASEVALLSHDLQVRALMIRQSKKSGEAFTEGSIRDVLEVARSNIAADKDEQARQSEAARDLAEQAAARAAEEAATARQDKEEAEKDLVGEREGRETDFDRVAARISNLVLTGAGWAAVLVILIYQVLAAPKPLGRSLPETLPGSLHLGASVLLTAGLVLSNSGAFGLNNRFGRARLHAWLSTHTAGYLRRARDGE